MTKKDKDEEDEVKKLNQEKRCYQKMEMIQALRRRKISVILTKAGERSKANV